MFDLIKSIFQSGSSQADAISGLDPSDLSLAEAALMFHVMAADGTVRESEREHMQALLSDKYGLAETEVSALMDAARQADNEAVDLYRFTSLIKQKLDREQRIRLIENLWEMVFADGKMHELEDNVVWRIAQLLDVENADRIAMKQRVRARMGADADASEGAD